MNTEKNELLGDINQLEQVANDLKVKLEEFKEDADAVEKEFNDFNQIESKVEDGLSKTEELEERLNKIN